MIGPVFHWFTTTRLTVIISAIVGLFVIAGYFATRGDRRRERQDARDTAEAEAKRAIEQRATLQPPPRPSLWHLVHDDKRVYVLTLSDADAHAVEIWSTPPGQVFEFGSPGDDRNTVRIDQYPIGRRLSLFINESGFGSQPTRVHLSWKQTPDTDESQQIDIY